jgi:hypothetical protein
MLELLRLIYPAQQRISFEIPQPLSVISADAKILLFDDMEALLKWIGAGVAADNTVAFNGGQSLHFDITNVAITRSALRTFAWTPPSKKSFSMYFNFDAAANFGVLTIEIGVGGREERAITLTYTAATGVWTYLAADGATTVNIPDAPAVDEDTWHFLKLVFDDNTMISLQVDERKIKFGDVAYYRGAGLGPSYAYIQITGERTAPNDADLWVDDVLIREE